MTSPGNFCVSDNIVEITKHLEGIQSEIEAMPAIPPDAMDYSELKMQLMVNYVSNLAYYISLKQKGDSVAQHPVFKHLAMLRTFLERLAPLDAALKYQIEKLLLSSTEEVTAGDESSVAGPNLAAFASVETSMKSALKSVSVDQVRDRLDGLAPGDRMEIDPSIIAARIAKLQSAAEKPGKKNTKKQKKIHESDDEEIVKSSKNKKTAKKISDDEEIDSDFDL